MPAGRWSKKMFTNKGTGTVPKVYPNNEITNEAHQFQNHHLSNNLDLSWQRQNSSNSRNLGRTTYELNPYTMEISAVEDRRQNDLLHINIPGRTNDALSTSSSSVSNSRRDSLGTIPKCDNVKKYPDKKQIEDQLNQIREYLRITTSLMSSIKNNDDQHAVKERDQFLKMINDLKGSEAKLLALLDDPLYDNFSDLPLARTDKEPIENGIDNVSECNASGYQRNGLEQKVEFTNRKVQLLREQQDALLNLKRKAENQLSEVRHLAEENRLSQQQVNGSNQLRNTKIDQSRIYSDAVTHANVKNYNENNTESDVKVIEDRGTIIKNDPLRYITVNSQENGIDRTYLLDRLDSSNELLHLLENRDGQLATEHTELQQKLNELQMKKTQIDQLAQQLQNLGDDEDEDIGNQVRKIVTMKQHLSSLKDLLEVVKNTEFSLLNTQNVNELEPESQENHLSICTKTDNIRQNVMNHNQNTGCNSVRANEQWLHEKDSNKTLIGIQEREKVLAELKAKKQELEEIMYKQKDRASINNDVCSEISINKSESSTNNNMFDGSVMSWLPVHPHHHNQIASAYSSDDCPEEDVNDYSDLNSAISVTLGNVAHHQPPSLGLNSAVNVNKSRTEPNTRMRGSVPREFIPHSSTLTPELRAKSTSTTASGFQRERSVNSINEAEQNKVQKQLELIQQVCQSLLDQQSSSGSVQQLRNNLTPSSLYTDPRGSMPTNQQVSAVNYIHPAVEMPYLNTQQISPQLFALNDVTNNQNMLTANALQTQAFLLNTVNQCCQMLWFQQREITSLRSMICSIQDQMLNRHIDQEMSEISPANPYIFPSQPTVYHAPSQPHNSTHKVNQVSSACSMPNLNPSSPHANIEGAFLNHNNIRSSPSARLLDSSLNNLSNQNLLGEQPANNTVLPTVNVANLNHSLPSQIWNGQALNNQVAPGNRANNYWDNFRSYSRQNLLSTSSKSNEGLQNPTTTERLNVLYDRSQSFSLPPNTSPKSNTVLNESVIVPGENTPRRHLHFKTLQNTSACNKTVPAIPPDVLNINHNAPHQKSSDNVESTIELVLGPSNASVETQSTKEHHNERVRNRNEWNDSEQLNNKPKSKLFDELRDNVYKEVANLISANENRPHFLIQLFRDLQHINSDSMRGRTLQSIQTVLTQSLMLSDNKRSANRQSSAISHQVITEQESVQLDPEHLWHLQAVGTMSSSEGSRMDSECEDSSINNILKSMITFLNSHKDEIFHQELIEAFRLLLIKYVRFAEIFKSRSIQEQAVIKRFGIIINESLEKYKGRRVSEISKDLLKTTTDILIGELSFIFLPHEYVPDSNCEIPSSNNPSSVHENMKLHLHQNIQVEDGHTPQMQNGDLAEADQSRIEVQQEDEEEGAVGGVLNGIVDVLSSNATTDQNDVPDITDLPKLDFTISTEPEVEFMEQGLDQVPTRLTTKSRSHSNTPSRDRSSSRNDTLEHF